MVVPRSNIHANVAGRNLVLDLQFGILELVKLLLLQHCYIVGLLEQIVPGFLVNLISKLLILHVHFLSLLITL